MPDTADTRRPRHADDPIDVATAWQWLLALRDNRQTNVGIELDDKGQWLTAHPMEEDASALLECLLPLARAPSWTIAQLGQSLDGRIATESGHSHYINGVDSLVHLHRLRALADAVVVGAETASADNPQLTVRHVSGPQPTRVVLDPRGRVAATTALFTTVSPPTLHMVGDGAHLETSCARVCRLALDEQGRFSPRAVIAALHAQGLQRILIEGGGVTVSQFLEAGSLDRLHLLVAPLLIGSGRPGLTMTPIDTLDSALRPTMRTFCCGDDTLFDVWLGSAAG